MTQVEELRQLLALVGLDKNGPLAGGILKSLRNFAMLAPEQQRMVHNVIARVEMLVGTVVGLCVRVLRLSGASIEAIMNANFERHVWPKEQPYPTSCKPKPEACSTAGVQRWQGGRRSASG